MPSAALPFAGSRSLLISADPAPVEPDGAAAAGVSPFPAGFWAGSAAHTKPDVAANAAIEIKYFFIDGVLLALLRFDPRRKNAAREKSFRYEQTGASRASASLTLGVDERVGLAAERHRLRTTGLISATGYCAGSDAAKVRRHWQNAPANRAPCLAGFCTHNLSNANRVHNGRAGVSAEHSAVRSRPAPAKRWRIRAAAANLRLDPYPDNKTPLALARRCSRRRIAHASRQATAATGLRLDR